LRIQIKGVSEERNENTAVKRNTINEKVSDDWRDGTQTRLQKSKLYLRLSELCKNDPSGSHIISLVDDACDYSYQKTKTIIRHMGEFTIHDSEHSFRVLNLMARLIPSETLEKISIPEILLLVLTAFFHDIGMAPSEKEVRALLKEWEEDEPTVWETTEFNKFKRFCDARPDISREIVRLHNAGNSPKANILEKFLVSEYTRLTHAIRARSIIDGEWKGKIKYRDIDLTVEFAQLCLSHSQDALSLLDMDTSLVCGPDVYACLPFVGVILRIADILDFDAKRTPEVLFSHLSVRNPVSLKEWMKHRSIEAWEISNRIIRFQARCEHPAIEAAIREFCDIIDSELISCNSVLSTLYDQYRQPFPDYYKFSFPPKIDRSKIGPKLDINGKPAYKYQNTQFKLSKRQVVDLLMGTKLYGNPEVALRELIQNSLDACSVRQAMEQSWRNSYEPKITVELIKKRRRKYSKGH
jgi:molecular chaperone HtpG